ncbi:type II toxin-antitoxin system VapB family antitoxin [Aestuariimicrobium ganziense]|uniref:type II toxin-antitoxin system VapB family antitoxin n=1 Tax=Aestuariimicrobium ganziense TaxID=2773677 RepID=UPI001942E218|nr:type II toxin-antitoxin system VapB family antitoxin [Aestuariimicrobium ganziense]
MGLNIKNPRVHELARAAAEATGKTQTGAIEEALEKLLREYGQDPEAAATAARADLIWSIAAEYIADPGHQHGEILSINDLYDDATGLPR